MSIITVIENVERRVRLASDGTTQEYFLGQLKSSKAYEATFVPVIADEASKVKRARTYLQETDNGYQRPGSYRRMEAFGSYILSNELRYTPAVVLSGRNKWEYSETERELTVTGPAAIIDGQHRVGGHLVAYQSDDFDRLIDFVVMNISIEEEQQLFLDINSNAKSVSTGIVSILGRRAGSEVAEALNSHGDSIFKGRFYIAQSSPGTLFNIASVAKEVGTTFRHGVFEGIKNDTDLQFDIMLGYWEIIASAFPAEWEDIDKKRNDREYKLLELTGLMAMSLAADEILATAFDMNSSTMDFDLVEKMVLFISESGELDWGKRGQFQNQTGFGGATPIYKKIQQILANFVLEA
jgi:DNA sulfur modification protein DndB